MTWLARFICFCILIAFLSACSTTPEIHKVAAQKANEQEYKEYREAEKEYKNKKYATALKRFTTFIQKHPQNNLTDHASFYAGQIYYDQGDYFRAARFWLYIVDGLMISEFYERALVGAAQCQMQMSRYDEALATVTRFHVTEKTDRALAARAYELSSKIKLIKGNGLGAIEDLLVASEYLQQTNEKQNLLNHAAEIVTGNLTQSQLEEGLSTPALQRFELLIRFRLGQILYDQKSFGGAKDQFSVIVSKFPDTEQAKSSQSYINSLDAQEKTDSTVIGVILPLSGKYSQMGYKTLRGVQMGLGLFNHNTSSPVKLAIIDSEGNADIARRGVDRLVTEDHAVAIIGDILSKTATAIASKSQELGVPCLALAQKQDLSEVGDFIFRNTLTPEMQMRTLVDIAMREKGYHRFAILYPNDSYGTEYASLFWDNVLQRGGEITAAQTYQPEETDFRDPVQRLVGTYYAEEDRGKELGMRMQAWTKDQVQANVPKSQRDKPPKDLLPPIVDFDAIFIADSPKAVGQIAPMLAYNDVTTVPLLGTNLWDTPQIVSRGGKFVENALFVDDFFSEDPSPTMRRFSSDFQAQFGYVPDVFEAQGYDTALLISQVLKNNGYGLTRSLLKDKLAQASVSSGSSGPLKMTPQREVEKSLVPLTIQGSKIVKFETGRGTAQ